MTKTITGAEYKALAQKPSKYRNVKTVVNGIEFHSKKEANRYVELLWEVEHGVIEKLELQPKFKMVVNGVWICTYVADFSYIHNQHPAVWTVEDCKGVKTPVYRMKKKLFDVLYKGSHRLIES